PTILGRRGPIPNLYRVECLEDKAAGARAKIYRGNRYDLNWSSKSPTITCKESGSATRRSSADGVSTRSQPTAHTRSWKLFRHRKSLRFFQLGDNGHSYCFFRRFFFPSLAPFACGIVVRVGSFLLRPDCFR